MSNANYFVHPTAEISDRARIGDDCKIWNQTQIREGASLGPRCIVGKNTYIDFGVVIGADCKIQNNCSIYHGAELEDGVFVGPHVVITNDKTPRAINEDGSPKGGDDWTVGKVLIERGASLGAGCIILPDITVGAFAMVGAGAVVTKDVPPYALVTGNPARIIGQVDAEGRRMRKAGSV